jgi:EAL domain-containing protein (putative c-di-GMP-specific phosphodiesterase class I)
VSAAAWPLPPDGGRPVAVRVNVSARQLDDDTFAGQVASCLESSGLDPARLVLEITESAPLRDPVVAHRACRGLRDLGVRVSLDDFGTGHCDLVRLAQLPCDEIKVDKALLVGLGRGSQRFNRVCEVVGLAAALGLAVTVEGVETRAQLAALRQLAGAADLSLQGYLFGPPLPLPTATLTELDGRSRQIVRRDMARLRVGSVPEPAPPTGCPGGRPPDESTGPSPVTRRQPPAPRPSTRPRVARTASAPS